MVGTFPVIHDWGAIVRVLQGMILSPTAPPRSSAPRITATATGMPPEMYSVDAIVPAILGMIHLLGARPHSLARRRFAIPTESSLVTWPKDVDVIAPLASTQALSVRQPCSARSLSALLAEVRSKAIWSAAAHADAFQGTILRLTALFRCLARTRLVMGTVWWLATLSMAVLVSAQMVTTYERIAPVSFPALSTPVMDEVWQCGIVQWHVVAIVSIDMILRRTASNHFRARTLRAGNTATPLETW